MRVLIDECLPAGLKVLRSQPLSEMDSRCHQKSKRCLLIRSPFTRRNAVYLRHDCHAVVS